MRTASGTVSATDNLKRDLEKGSRVQLRRGGPNRPVRVVGGKESRTLSFVCSTDGVKRDGNRVRNEEGSWDFGNFAKNPVMLWCHDYGGFAPPEPPIGKWSNWRIEKIGEGAALVMDATFAHHDFADLIFRLYLPEDSGGDGVLRAVSIGWTPLVWEPVLDADGRQIGFDFVRSELLECSAVPIPADPDAIMAAAQRGLIPEGMVERFSLTPRRTQAGIYLLDSREEPSERFDPGAGSPAATPATPPAGAPPDDEAKEDKGEQDDPVKAVADSTKALGDALAAVQSLELKAGDQATTGALGALVEAASDVGEAVGVLAAKFTSPPQPEEEPTESPDPMAATPAAALAAIEALTQRVDELAAAASESPEQRVGKKISQARRDRLAQAHDNAGRCMKLIRGVLDEEPVDETGDSNQMAAEAAALDAATSRLAERFGPATPADDNRDEADAEYVRLMIGLEKIGDRLSSKPHAA